MNQAYLRKWVANLGVSAGLERNLSEIRPEE